ncbi:hypothetical protein ACFSE2_19580, partial [Ramlibacter ginsenosidimutans]
PAAAQPGNGTPGPAAAPGWGPPGVAPPAPRPALPPAPVILPPSPRAIVPGPWNTQRRSLADMANEQLRRERKDPFEQGVEGAGRDDCLHAPAQEPRAGGLLQAPVVIGRALSGNCAK